MKDLRMFKEEPAFLEQFQRMFRGYPEMARDVMNKMFIVDGPAGKVKDAMVPPLREVGLLNLLQDARKAMRAL